MEFLTQNRLSIRAFARGGLAHDKVVRSMRLFAEKVIPKVA